MKVILFLRGDRMGWDRLLEHTSGTRFTASSGVTWGGIVGRKGLSVPRSFSWTLFRVEKGQ